MTRRRRGAVDDDNVDDNVDNDDSQPQTSSPRTRWREQQEGQSGARRVADALNKGYSPDGNTLAVTLRYGLSALMHVCVVGYVARMMWIGGLWDIGGSFLQVRFGSPCGASPHKEYVVLSSRIVLDKGVVSGGFHVRGGMIGGTYFGGSSAALANRTRILSVLAPGDPDIPVLDFGDKVGGIIVVVVGVVVVVVDSWVSGRVGRERGGVDGSVGTVHPLGTTRSEVG